MFTMMSSHVAFLFVFIATMAFPAFGETSPTIPAVMIPHSGEGGWSQDPHAIMLLASFAALRISVVLRSMSDKTPHALWRGVAVGCITRCIADGIQMPDGLDSFVGMAPIFAEIFVREAVQTYGLLTVLRLIPERSSSEADC